MSAAKLDAAIGALDEARMSDECEQVPQAIEIGRNTFGVIRHNLTIRAIFNLAGIGLASVDILSPTAAAFAYIMPDLLVLLNSSRLLW